MNACIADTPGVHVYTVSVVPLRKSLGADRNLADLSEIIFPDEPYRHRGLMGSAA
ncbi:hypothetical protein L484_026323 [Morus notabilis]|uniref:Uncharacterized protein n=1 Tax=Morus notabilis TaxID=981085 RepID=W9R8D8_9ROSA|nr:hypothetical protein L484_026323 [Morus notabilis]